MAMVINSNIMSLNAQRNLTMSQGDQNQAMERLTSGKRINSAADDAAGLAISNRMTSQVRGLDQAIRNANDGISLIQTAEGALDETTNILQRMRELSIQSANGTYDDGNRSTLDAEVQQLIAEIDRISETTKFNGLQILDGTLGDVDLQAGADSNETISLSIGATDTKSLGNGSSASVTGSALGGTELGTDLLAGLNNIADDGTNDMFINGQSVGDLSGETTLQGALDEMNSNLTGVTVSAFAEITATTTGDGVIQDGENIQFDVTMADDTVQTFQVSNTGSMDELIAAINDVSGGTLEASLTDDGYLNIRAEGTTSIEITETTVTSEDAMGTGMESGNVQMSQLAITADAGTDEITVKYTTAGDAAETGIDARENQGEISGSQAQAAADIDAGFVTINGHTFGEYDNTVDYDGNDSAGDESDLVAWLNESSAETGVIASLDDSVTTGVLKLTSVDGSDISVSYKSGEEAGMETILGIQETNSAVGSGSSVANIDISTAAGAQKAIDTIDAALEQINSTRGDLGAVNNRLDFTVNNLSNVSENVAAARSRIEDADFAAESAALSRAQVLQQAGTAMLAQANAAPQQVLSLLQ
jgi:flagellin